MLAWVVVLPGLAETFGKAGPNDPSYGLMLAVR